MGVILSGYYRRQENPTICVPAPSDGAGIPFWYDHLASHAHAYAAAGFTHLLLPPVSMSSALHYPTADGYGVYNDYDLGSDKQPTRYGTAERLQRCCAILHANGIKPLVDWVPHQRIGGAGGYYNYKSAMQKPGRFPKHPGCFRERYKGDPGRVPQDPVASPWDDIMFGDQLSPINAVPKGYVMTGLLDHAEWLWRRLDLGGCRNDCTKGQAFAFVNRFANHGMVKQGVVIGEYAEGNKDTLAWWVRSTNFRCYTYDFEVKYRIRDMCNAGSKYDMRRLVNAGLAAWGWPYSGCAVTFVENHDSDTNGFGAAVFNKLLGYAWILTAEGWPSVYFRDYAKEDYCYGLKPYLDNLIWIHEHLAGGTTKWRHAEYQFVVYERLGWQVGLPGVLVGLNNDVWDQRWKQVTVQTDFGPHRRLHDYTGHAEHDVWTDRSGRVTIRIPPNANGHGYVCFAPAGHSAPNRQHSWVTTQVFEGAEDLDILPALRGQVTPVTRIWVAKGSTAQLTLRLLADAPAGALQLAVRGPDKQLLDLDGGAFTAEVDGWHTLQVHARPAAPDVTPFKLTAVYKSTKHLAGS